MARGDLTDGQWALLEPLLPPQRSGERGRQWRDHRQVIDGILWVARTGAPWGDLPGRYGPVSTCHGRHVRWGRDGTWARVLQALQGAADAPGGAGEAVQWEGCAADSTSVKAHPHAAGARKAPAKKGAPQGQKGARVRRRVPLRTLQRRERPTRRWAAAGAG